MVRAEGVSFKVGKQTLLETTSVRFEEGSFHVIMGANGAGKSTLLKILSGHLSPASGNVYLAGKALDAYSQKELALKRAVLSQQYNLSFPITVFDVVLMGRYPHYGATPSAHDINICQQALALMEMEPFSQRDYTTLSGGEAQKVHMSRVLAQIWNKDTGEKKVLFLDEPVSSMDVKYQYQLMRIAKQCCAQNTTVIAILHDINLALAFADRLLFLKNGAIRHELTNPADLTPDVIQDTYGVSSSIIRTSGHARPIVVF